MQQNRQVHIVYVTKWTYIYLCPYLSIYACMVYICAELMKSSYRRNDVTCVRRGAMTCPRRKARIARDSSVIDDARRRTVHYHFQRPSPASYTPFNLSYPSSAARLYPLSTVCVLYNPPSSAKPHRPRWI